MKQLVFGFYKDILEEERFTEMTMAVIIDACYNKKKHPRSMEDLTTNELEDILGKSVYFNYKEDKKWEEKTTGDLIILRECKRDKESMSIKKMILRADRDYQEEMICDIVGSCLAIPDELLHKYIVEQKTVRKISQIFKYPEGGVKLRLIKYYYDHVVTRLEECEKKEVCT